ncbi:MAG: hypothetical protein OEY18_13860 [Candidatus Aminicenantes bacterium]|nr:hypothetical protein [Candidatus Aminicenantes bacterium]
MKKHFSLSFLFLICFMIRSGNVFSLLPSGPQENNRISLEKILKKCAEYCERLSQSSIIFSCRETIEEKIHYSHPDSGRILKFSGDKKYRKNERYLYVYDYTFSLQDNRIEDSRILIKEDGQKKREEDAQLKTKMFKDKIVFFEPIGLLSDSWQRHHEYKLSKGTNLKREKSILIEAIPKSQEESSLLSAKLWISGEDFSVLKIEWTQTSLGGFEGVAKTTEGLDVQPRVMFVSEYAIEKNGIRFPSKYFIKETYLGPDQKRFIRSETQIRYDNHHFITVETNIKD